MLGASPVVNEGNGNETLKRGTSTRWRGIETSKTATWLKSMEIGRVAKAYFFLSSFFLWTLSLNFLLPMPGKRNTPFDY